MSVIEAALVTLTCTGSFMTSVSGSKGHATFLSVGAVLLRSTLQASDLPEPTATLEGRPKSVVLKHR